MEPTIQEKYKIYKICRSWGGNRPAWQAIESMRNWFNARKAARHLGFPLEE